MIKKVLFFSLSIFLISCGANEAPKEVKQPEVSVVTTENKKEEEKKETEVKKEEVKKEPEVKVEVKKEEVKKEPEVKVEEKKEEEVVVVEAKKEEMPKIETPTTTSQQIATVTPTEVKPAETQDKPVVELSKNVFRHRADQRIKLIDPSLDIEGVDFSVVKDLGDAILVGKDKQVTLNKEKFKSVFLSNSGLPSYYAGEKINPIKRPVDKTKKHIVFSYDDGPRNMYHELIREEFNKYNQTAVFAVMGVHVKKNPNMLLKTYKDGHEIMGHSYNHPILSKLPYDKIWQEYANTNDEIFKVTGLDVKFLRPPYGAFNKDVISAVGGRRNIVLWNVDTEDWKNRNTQVIVERVLSTLKDGNIVLFHDVFKESYEATKILIPMLIEKGYQFISYEDMIQLRKGR